MLIIVKTLQNKQYDLEVNENETVGQIKDKIDKQFNLGEPECQTLVLRGKILKDDQTASGAGFKDKDFLVVMVKKGKKNDKKKKKIKNNNQKMRNKHPIHNNSNHNKINHWIHQIQLSALN